MNLKTDVLDLDNKVEDHPDPWETKKITDLRRSESRTMAKTQHWNVSKLEEKFLVQKPDLGGPKSAGDDLAGVGDHAGGVGHHGVDPLPALRVVDGVRQPQAHVRHRQLTRARVT